MRRKIRKFISIGAALAISAMTVPVMASTPYTPVAGTSCNFNKYLIMDDGDSVPNATFSFTVAPGSARSADTSDNSVMQVLPGIGTPTIADVTFAPGDTTQTTAGTNIDVARAASERATGATAATGVELETGEKYATKQATVSFSGISFPEPGIYRYIVTETANAAHESAGIHHDDDVDRVLDVYVVHSEGTAAVAPTVWTYGGQDYNSQAEAEAASAADGGAQGAITNNGVAATEGGLTVAAYVMHTNDDDVVINTSMGSADVAAAGAALTDKTDGFTNEANGLKDLKVNKEVAGNQASRDKYFEFTVTCTDVAAADSFVVSIADDSNANTNDGNADATSIETAATIAANAGKTNPTTVTGAQLLAGQKFYLQHGQSVVIRGLPKNSSYTVTENAEDYSSAVMSGKTNSGNIGTVTGTNKMAEAGFTNTRNGVIPTGIFIGLGPCVALALVGGVGLALKLRKKDELEEEAK